MKEIHTWCKTRGQIGPTQKETKREKEKEFLGAPQFRRQRRFFRRVYSRRTGWRQKAHMVFDRLRQYIRFPRQWEAFLIFFFFLSSFKHETLQTSSLRCEGLFIRGALFLLIIAQESQSLALPVSYKFFKRYIYQTLDTWLADFRAEISGKVCVPLCLFISPIQSLLTCESLCILGKTSFYKRGVCSGAAVGLSFQRGFLRTCVSAGKWMRGNTSQCSL